MFKKTLEMVENSNEFKEFHKENPDIELVTGFFIIDFFGNDNKRSVDYRLGDKIFTFSLRDDDTIKMNQDEFPQKDPVTLDIIDTDIKIDTDEVKKLAEIQIRDQNVSSKINKLIAVLQKSNGNQIWSLTAMLEGLIIFHIIVDPFTGNVTKCERKSMMDLIRKK